MEVDASNSINPTIAALRKQGPVVGYVGQLIGRKNIQQLLQAFAEWRCPEANLVLVGEGDARASLEAEAAALKISEQVHFTGWRNDRLDWMRGMDLFVLPSIVEGVPRCLMEAMAARTAVAASDIPGNRGLVEHGKTGQLFALHNVQALTDCLAQMNDISHLAAMTAQARQLIEREYCSSVMARRYEKLFDALAG
jgi:glycosyltransferase involved in cell wall biosynthesis